MACCPLSLADNKVLDFEKEEEQIFTATNKYPVDIITEDSGSLSGLYERLYEEGQGDLILSTLQVMQLRILVKARSL